MSYSGQLDLMWLSLFGTQLIAAVALIIVFLILCYRRGLEPHHSLMVILPVVIGLGFDSSIPSSVKGVILAISGVVVFLGTIRLFKM